MLQIAVAGSTAGQLLVWTKSAEFKPLIEMPERLMGVWPVFVSVSGCGVILEPIPELPNEMAVPEGCNPEVTCKPSLKSWGATVREGRNGTEAVTRLKRAEVLRVGLAASCRTEVNV